MAGESPVTGADPLDGFWPATRAWFDGAFAEPTPAQAGAWRAIGKGEDTLVVAPTGSGKTLAAFLWAIDRLAAVPPPADSEGSKRRTRVLYISPLKALAVDIERNLRAPLTGIRHAAHRLGLDEPDIAVAVRTGDTAAEERRKLISKPPDILITTPESLFLLLTSQARETLRGVETVIVDEVHAVAGNSGAPTWPSAWSAWTSCSPGRPDVSDCRPPCVRPTKLPVFSAEYTVTVVQTCRHYKAWDLKVKVPVEDMANLGMLVETNMRNSLWPAIEARLVERVREHNSTIIFANSQQLAERLCARLNEVRVRGRTGPGSPPAR